MLSNQISFFQDVNRFAYKLDSFSSTDNIKPKVKYKSIELFAGAGGMALGIEQAGFENILSIEIDKDACKTLRENRPNWNVLEGDINEIAKKGISNYVNYQGEIDLIAGGVPCQAFSYAGKGKGFADTRGTLFYPMSIIIEDVKPKTFILENVKGLTTHDNGRTLETMIEIFENIGYTIFWNVLNSWDYDTAQKRERLIMIGIRNDLYENQIFDYNYPEKQEYKPVLKDILKDVPESIGRKYSDKKYSIMKLVPQGGCWIDLPEDVAKEYMKGSYYLGGGKRGVARRMSWDEPSLTLTTAPDMKQTERCHPDETRPFTVREYARIQSFPDYWKFSGGMTSQYKQIGNAVPVNLAKYVGLSLVKYLNQFITIN
ncbi:DNA cytosine methyltransferase [Helcococcus sueciensis]|uniref:DNA cytosine methyltransferase n=1 Tax=Helcococcus sueciensis TaxID=241555 RepID=UPI0004101478|nr:DNA cytosine methyltransferase [Helcococcus sueciensis]